MAGRPLLGKSGPRRAGLDMARLRVKGFADDDGCSHQGNTRPDRWRWGACWWARCSTSHRSASASSTPGSPSAASSLETSSRPASSSNGPPSPSATGACPTCPTIRKSVAGNFRDSRTKRSFERAAPNTTADAEREREELQQQHAETVEHVENTDVRLRERELVGEVDRECRVHLRDDQRRDGCATRTARPARPAPDPSADDAGTAPGCRA